MNRNILVALLLLAPVTPVVGQDLPKGQFPEGFRVRTDRPDQSPADIVFVTMTPGWHITMGPAAILYDPSNTASGEYRVESETFLFDPANRNEAYGFFVGGRDLDGDTQAYSYFLIRRSGEFLVKRRSGQETSVVIDWTAHDAILKYDEKGDADTARNVLAVDVAADEVHFFVNGQRVASLPRDRLDTDGVVGLRVNHAVNVHVSSLDITRR